MPGFVDLEGESGLSITRCQRDMVAAVSEATFEQGQRHGGGRVRLICHVHESHSFYHWSGHHSCRHDYVGRRRRCGRHRRLNRVGLAGEVALSAVEHDSDGTAHRIRDSEIRSSVIVHIAHRHGGRRGSHREGRLGPKRAIPVAEEDADAIASAVRDDRVRLPIAVEISQRHRIWERSRGKSLLGLKRPIPVP